VVGAIYVLVRVVRRLKHESRLPVEQRTNARAAVLYQRLPAALKVLFWMAWIGLVILGIILKH
jgi:hypothetical protein